MSIRKVCISLVLVAAGMFGGSVARADVCQTIPGTPTIPPQSVCVAANADGNQMSACVRGLGYGVCADHRVTPAQSPGVDHCSSVYTQPWVTFPPPSPLWGPPIQSFYTCGYEHTSDNGFAFCEQYALACGGGTADESGANANAQGRRIHADPSGVTYDRGNGSNDSCEVLAIVYTCGNDHAGAGSEDPNARFKQCATVYLIGPIPPGLPWSVNPCNDVQTSSAGASARVNEKTNCVNASVTPRGTEPPGFVTGTVC